MDAQTNKEYGNMIFPIKRVFLIKKEQGYKIKVLPDGTIDDKEQKDEVAFVPPCTKNVFTKFYTDTPTGLLEWTRPDAEAYLQDIKEKLEAYRDKEDNS